MNKNEQGSRALWEVFMWNRSLPGGSLITYADDFGNLIETSTRSPAWVLASGTPVVQIEGKSGSFLLYRCRPRIADAEAKNANQG